MCVCVCDSIPSREIHSQSGKARVGQIERVALTYTCYQV